MVAGAPTPTSHSDRSLSLIWSPFKSVIASPSDPVAQGRAGEDCGCLPSLAACEALSKIVRTTPQGRGFQVRSSSIPSIMFFMCVVSSAVHQKLTSGSRKPPRAVGRGQLSHTHSTLSSLYPSILRGKLMSGPGLVQLREHGNRVDVIPSTVLTYYTHRKCNGLWCGPGCASKHLGSCGHHRIKKILVF